MTQGISILCVDDDASMLLIYQSVLGERGYEVRLCHDGSEVMECLQNRAPELIILDIQMPKVTGLAVCEMLRRDPNYSDIPIIVASVTDSERVIVEALSYGAVDYLVKPLKPQELLAKVSVVLDRHKSGEAAAPSDDFANNYEIVGHLGRSTNSTVYLAWDQRPSVHESVCVKIIQPSESGVVDLQPSNDTRYLQPPVDCAPNVRDIGKTETQTYVVTDWIEGSGVDSLLVAMQYLHEEMLAVMMYQVISALLELEEHGMVHHNLKPSNIIISKEGDVLIQDFAGLWQRGSMKFEPTYTAPELLVGDAGDIRSDLFSLGCIVYDAATGHAPFPANSGFEIIHQQLNSVPPRIDEQMSGFSDVFASIVNDTLYPDPNDRCTLLDAKQRLVPLVQ